MLICGGNSPTCIRCARSPCRCAPQESEFEIRVSLADILAGFPDVGFTDADLGYTIEGVNHWHTSPLEAVKPPAPQKPARRPPGSPILAARANATDPTTRFDETDDLRDLRQLYRNPARAKSGQPTVYMDGMGTARAARGDRTRRISSRKPASARCRRLLKHPSVWRETQATAVRYSAGRRSEDLRAEALRNACRSRGRIEPLNG
jgi:hypothetical protein